MVTQPPNSLLHITDTHLGYAAYGLTERADDFALAFEQAIDVAIDEGVDGVVHTGDISHSSALSEPVPSVLIDQLASLEAANIPFYAVLGNHDLRDGQPQPWISYLEANGLLQRLARTPTYVGDVALYGLDYRPPEWWADPDLSFEPPDDDRFCLLSLHQSLAPLAPGEPEYNVETLLRKATVEFDAVALGHSHYTASTVVNGVPVFYGGATERTSRTYEDDRPCVHLLEAGPDEFTRRQHHLDTRPFVTVTIILGEHTTITDIEQALHATDLEGAVANLLVGGSDPVSIAEVERCAEQHGPLDVTATRIRTEGFDPGIWIGAPDELADDAQPVATFDDDTTEGGTETRLLHVGSTYLGRYNVDGARKADFARSLQFAVDEGLERDIDAVIQTGNLFGTKSPSQSAIESCRTALERLEKAGVPCYHTSSEREVALDAIDELVDEGLLHPVGSSGKRVGDVGIYGIPPVETGTVLRSLKYIEPLNVDTHVVAGHWEVSPPLAEGIELQTVIEEAPFDVAGVLGGGTPEPAVYDETPIVSYPGSAERLFGLYTFDNDITCPCEVTEVTIGDGIEREQISLPVRKTVTLDLELDAKATPADVTDLISQDEVADANVLVRLRGTAPPEGPNLEAAIRNYASDAYLVAVWDKRQVDQNARGPTVSALVSESTEAATVDAIEGPDDETEADAPPSTGTDGAKADDSTATEDNEWPDAVSTSTASQTEASKSATCSFTVTSTEWERNHGRDAPLDSKWQCEREQVGKSDFCLFHMPTAEREAREIDTEEVTKAFITAVEREGREAKTFVGARLPGLALSHMMVRPPDNHPIDLRLAEIEGEVSLSDARLENQLLLDGASTGLIDCEGATLAGLSCTGSLLEGGLDGRTAIIEGDLVLEDAHIDGNCYFREATIRGTVDATDLAVDGRTSFGECRIRGQATFKDAIFKGDATFGATTFEGLTLFQRASVVGTESRATFLAATFTDRAYFTGMTFDGEADFSRARLGPDITKFADCTFHGKATFEDAICGGQLTFISVDYDHDPATFEALASFEGMAVEGSAQFDGVTFTCAPTFADATFADHLSLPGATFDDPEGEQVTFDGMAVRGETDFSDARFRIPATFVEITVRKADFRVDQFDAVTFDGATFHGPGRFDDATVGGDLRFRDAQCTNTSGVPETVGKSLSFDGAKLAGSADFTELGAVAAAFNGTTLTEDVVFEDADVDRLTLAPRCDDHVHIDFSGARIQSGQLNQPGDGRVTYILDRAILGRVDLAVPDHPDGFDRYRFRETTFEEFPFSQYRGALAVSDWRIHATDEEETDGWVPADHLSRVTRYGRLLSSALARDVDATRRRKHYGALEATYLQAKTGADGVGDNKATAEFFRRELINRRRRNWWRLRDPMFEGSRVGAGWRWAKNAVFGGIAGHGERPARVFFTSGVTLAVFALAFAVFLPPGSDADPVTLSIGSFVTLLFGTTASVNRTLVNWLAQVEGFLGAFLIALLVFALTRSSYR